MFNLVMKADARETEGTYKYIIRAQAEGGLESFASGTIEITPRCAGVLLDSFEKEAIRFLPNGGTATRVVYSKASEFIGKSEEVCS